MRWLEMRKLAAAPVFSLGFRPFFFAGAVFAAVAVAIWALWLYGRLPGAQPMGGMLSWHRHEMPFGFATAIIAGFLLAAVSFASGFNDVPRLWLAALFLLMGALHLLRLWRWHDRGIWRVPLLWSHRASVATVENRGAGVCLAGRR
jgi:uncharacterized protein involved in response to NO